MGWKQLIPGHARRVEKVVEEVPLPQVVEQCHCSRGHNILSEDHLYSGYPGILLKLKTAEKEGLLSLSPIIGDTDRTFHGTKWGSGEIVEICCPVCDEPFPIYNQCGCNAHLIALFTSPDNDFSNCIGICQRIGCLNAEIISGRELRMLDRVNYF
ncbi:hypothetical protein SAMN02745165_02044 [Malonomonas rubra DSM 5091]|uniref:Uncharacterized protein n=1 Tax=Malonomonas rubra DSM 5091 TaxID=1122189 RepID=A0A1M6I756_MALRU|nr:hypothetical protein [Malonomonas rubra]SHJ30301.1 hypothetical protein SAMN02745165_02044 [Malonomonas rubra DSM 5091]